MGGMRILCKGKPDLKKGQSLQIALRCPEGTINVIGRAVRIRRRGFRTFEIGIQFLNLSKPVAAAIGSLAQFGFITGKAQASSGTDIGDGGNTQADSKASVRVAANLPDFYKVLGVAPSATADDIRDAYRQLARKHHPDVSDSEEDAARFLKIKNAYEVLKDPERRRMFDEYLAA